MRLFSLPVSCLFAINVSLIVAAQTPTQPSRTTACSADQSLPSPADQALYRQDYQAAAKLYASDKDNLAAQAGLVRARFGQEKPNEAVTIAEELAQKNPQSPIAIEIMGEAYIHAGEMEMASDPIERALKLNPCLGRTHFAAGRLLFLSGNRASAAQQFSLAHSLAPNDLEITYQWMGTLPRSEVGARRVNFLKANEYFSPALRKVLINNLAAGDEAEIATTVSVKSLPVFIKIAPGFEYDNQGRVSVVEVEVNTHKLRLVLNSGSAGIQLNVSNAASIGLTSLGQFKREPGLGPFPGELYLSVADSVRIGEIEFGHLPVTVLKLDSGIRSFSNYDGQIGLGLFRDFLVHLDLGHGLIQLSQLPAAHSSNAEKEAALRASDIVPGSTVPSSISHGFPQVDRLISPEMRSWSSFYGNGTGILLSTRFGRAPKRLFTLEVGVEQPRISPDAYAVASTLRKAGLSIPGTDYQGNFMGFAGLYIPINTWVTQPFGTGDVNISGVIGRNSINGAPFTVDYRDNVIHFEPGAH